MSVNQETKCTLEFSPIKRQILIGNTKQRFHKPLSSTFPDMKMKASPTWKKALAFYLHDYKFCAVCIILVIL